MKLTISNLISAVAVAIIFSFVFYFFSILFKNAFQADDSEFTRQMLSGFAGAFFAFLFIRLGEALTRIYDRAAKNINALVKLQYAFNDVLNELSDNSFIADEFIAILTKSIKTRNPILVTNRFRAVNLDKQILLDLTNIELINEIYFFCADLEKYNKSSETLNITYSQMATGLVDGKLTLVSYMAGIEYTLEKLTETKKFLTGYSEDAISLLATIRIMTKNAPILTRIIRFISRTHYPRGFKDLQRKEIQKLTEEIEATKHKSKAKIDKVSSGQSVLND